MTFNPETEIVSSSHDPVKRFHTYVAERNGKRWTVSIPDAEFAEFGPVVGASAAVNKQARRTYLARKMTAAMDGPADGA